VDSFHKMERESIVSEMRAGGGGNAHGISTFKANKQIIHLGTTAGTDRLIRET